jgi:hypothetical protein
MAEVGKSTPEYESYDDDLIQYGLIEKSYKVSISLLELGDKHIEISTYSRRTIECTKVEEVVPYRKHK